MARGPLTRLVARTLDRVLRARLEPFSEQELRCSALVVAPHPDDETLGCGGTIARKRALGADVGIVFLTDGATSHLRFVDRVEMAEIRRAEAVRAAALLGVAEVDVCFLPIRSRDLHSNEEQAVELLAEVLRARAPDELFVPYRLEMPADHADAYRVALAAAARCQTRPQIRQYAVWFWQHWPWTRFEHYAPRSHWRRGVESIRAIIHLLYDFRRGTFIADLLDTKRAALAAHKSQTVRRDGNPEWGILDDVSDGDFVERLLGPYEFFAGEKGRDLERD